MMNKRKDTINASPLGRVPGLEELSAVLAGQTDVSAIVPVPAAPLLRDGTLVIGAFELSPRGLVVDGAPPAEAFDQIGAVIGRLQAGLQWIIGDYMRLVEMQHGRTYEDVAAITGLEVSALYQYAYVARNVDFSIRIENLTFGHHQAVVSMQADLQSAWLRFAALNGWSIRVMRTAMDVIGQLDEGVRLEWVEFAISQKWDIDALKAAVGKALTPTLSSGDGGNSAQKSLFSRENIKELKKIARMVGKAQAGDRRAALTVKGWIAEQRRLLDELERGVES